MSLPVLDLDALLEAAKHDPPWLVRGLLTRESLVCLVGDAGVGKSTLCYYLSVCVAGGLPFLGHHTNQADVLYVDNENSIVDLSRYFSRVWHGLGKPAGLQGKLHIAHLQIGGGGPKWDDRLALYTNEFRPGLIVIDTAGVVCDIKDENDNATAFDVCTKLRRISKDHKATVIILKHARFVHETGKFDIRGAKAWKGATDATWFHKRHKGKPRKDGLTKTILGPADGGKKRAVGLEHDLLIDPRYTGTSDADKGLVLQAVEHDDDD